MDFHTMKRKELQALCKKHKIPANLKNVEMADRLASLFKVDDEEPEEQLVKPCLKNLEVLCVTDGEISEDKEPKKVRFSPQNQTFVFEKTNPRAMRVAARRRNSTAVYEDKTSKEESVAAVEDGKNKGKEKATVTRSTRQQKRDREVDETVSTVEDSSIADQCQTRRSALISLRKSMVVIGQKNDKKSASEVQDKAVSSSSVSALEVAKEMVKQKARVTNNTRQLKRGRGVSETDITAEDASTVNQCLKKRSIKQGNSRCLGKSDKQTRCVGKRKSSSLKHAEDLQTDPLAKPVDLVNNSEVGDLVKSVCEAVDIQKMLCNDSCAVEDNQDRSQPLDQTKSPTPLLDGCILKKAKEGSSETSIQIKELTQEKALLNKESSSEKIVLTKQQESSVFSSNKEGILLELYCSDGDTTKEDDKEANTDKEKEYKEAVFLNGGSSEDVEIQPVTSSGLKSSPQSATSTVLRSCTEDSKTELGSSAGTSLAVCETIFQGMYQPQHETVIPCSMMIECEPNKGEGSSVKLTESKDQSVGAIPSNEQGQMTWTSNGLESVPEEEGTAPDICNIEGPISRVHMADVISHPNTNEPATPKEEGIVPDFCNLGSQIARDDIADVKSYVNINKFQSRLQKPDGSPERSTLVSNEPLDSHDSGKNVGYAQDTVVTPTATVDEKVESLDGIGTCIIDRTEDSAESEIKHKQGLDDVLNSQTIHEEINGIATVKDSVVSSNVHGGRDMVDGSDVQMNGNHEDAVLADYNLEKGNIEPILTAMDDEKTERYDTLISDSSGDTADFEMSHKQGLEGANKSQFTSGEESYGIATLFELENAEDGKKLIEPSEVEMDKKTSPQSADMLLFPSSGFKSTPRSGISVPISCTGDSKTELANPSSKFDSCIQSARPLLSVPVCELGLQDTCQTQQEAGIPSSVIVECEADNQELSSIKNSELEDQFTTTISSNEQDQMTWTSNTVNSVIPKGNHSRDVAFISRDEGITHDMCNLEGQFSDVLPNDNYEDAALADQKMEGQFHKEKAGRLEGCDQDTDGVTPTTVVGLIQRSKGFVNCKSDRFECSAESEKNYKQALDEETISQTIHEETHDIASPQSADMLLFPSSGFKSTPHSGVSVPISCTGDSKTELANSASKFDSCIQSARPLISSSVDKFGISVSVCDLGLQGTCQTQHEAVIPSLVIVECEANNRELSLIKNSELEDQFTATISSNEQDQMTWTSNTVNSVTPKGNQSRDVAFISREECITPDLGNLEGQFSRYDFANVKSYASHEEFQSRLHNLSDTPDLSTMVSNELVDSRTDERTGLGSHEAVIDRIKRSDGIDNLIGEINCKLGVEKETNSQSCHDETNGFAADVHLNDNHEEAVLSDKNVDGQIDEEKAGKILGCDQDVEGVSPPPTATESFDRSEGIDSYISVKSEYTAEESNDSQSISEETSGIATEKDSVVVSNVPDGGKMTDVLDALLNDNYGDAALADQKMEGQFHKEKAGRLEGCDQDTKGVTPTTVVGLIERSVGIVNCKSDCFECSAESEKNYKQGLEEETISQTIHEETNDIAAEEDNVVISKMHEQSDMIDVQLNGNHEVDENLEVDEDRSHQQGLEAANNSHFTSGDTSRETLEACERLGDSSHPTDLDEYGSNSQNRSAIVLQGSEEKLIIQCSLDKGMGEELGTCVESRATVELFSLSQERTELEEDFIGIGKNMGCDQDAEGVPPTTFNDSVVFINVPEGGNMTHEDEALTDEKMEVQFHKEKAGRFEGCDQDTDVVTPTSEGIVNCKSDYLKYSAESESNDKQGLEEEAISQTIPEETYRIADAVSPDQNLESDEDNTGEESFSIASLFQSQFPEVDEDNAGEDAVSDDQNLEVDVDNAGEESYCIASLFQSEFPEDDKGETYRETSEVSEKIGDVSNPMDWEEHGSNSQSSPAIDLQGPEEKLTIQSSADEENRTCADSRATIEQICPSSRHTESEEDFIGLSVLERIIEQTEQQSGNENFLLTHEPQKTEGENFSLTPEAEGLAHSEPSVTKIDDQCKPAYVTGFSKEDENESQLEMNHLNDEAVDAELDKVENTTCKPTSMMNQAKRRILIHGTPRRPIKTADMKENSTLHLKRELPLGDATALRPMAKRKALEELHRK